MRELIILPILLVAIFGLPQLINTSTEENDNWNDSCRDSGYRQGQNGQFSKDTYDHCGDESGGDDAYYNGFIDGCTDAGNSREVCESASDS